MYKRFLVFGLILLMGYQFLFKAGIMAYYYANKTYIAQVLCINKLNPESHCDGKCYLKSQLAKAESPADSESLPEVTKYDAPVYEHVFQNIRLWCPNGFSLHSEFAYLNLYDFTFQRELLRPPLAS